MGKRKRKIVCSPHPSRDSLPRESGRGVARKGSPSSFDKVLGALSIVCLGVFHGLGEEEDYVGFIA